METLSVRHSSTVHLTEPCLMVHQVILTWSSIFAIIDISTTPPTHDRIRRPPFTSPIPATPSSPTPGSNTASNTLSNTLFKGSVYTVWAGCVNCYRVVKAAGYWEQRVM